MNETTQKGRRLGRAVLIASLAANVLLVSFIGVVAYKRFVWRAALESPPKAIQLVKKRLPASDGAILDEVYRAKEREFVVAQAELDKALQDVVAILNRPDLDAEVLRASIQTAREKRLRVADLTIDIFIETVVKISPQVRQNLAKKITMW